jgi:hypothetical protein
MHINNVIQELQNKSNKINDEIAVLNDCLKYYDYFSKISDSQNMYVAEMRRQMTTFLKSKGLKYKEIGYVICRTRNLASKYKNIPNNPNIENLISENLFYWIKNYLYPEVLKLSVVNEFTHTGRAMETSYKLIKIKDHADIN